MAFATLVAFVAVAPWVYTAIGMATMKTIHDAFMTEVESILTPEQFQKWLRMNKPGPGGPGR